MMTIEVTSSTIRTLKGAPLSCLMLLALAGQPVSAEYLERNSGYSDKPVLAALRLLEEYGLISQNGRYAWQISDGAKQLPLIASDELLSDNNSYSQQGDKITNNEVDAPAQSSDEEDQIGVVVDGEKSDSSKTTRPLRGLAQNARNNSDSEKFRVPSSSRSINPVVNPESEEPLLERAEAEAEKIRVRDVLAACDRVGIREPKRSEIAQNQRVFADLVLYHAELAPNNLGLAIYRILHGWNIKPGWKSREAEPVRAQTSTRPMVDDALAGAWKSAQGSIEAGMRPVDYQTWVAGLEVVSERAGVVVVDGHNDMTLAWVSEHCLTALQAAISEALGREVQIELVKGW